MRVDRDELVIIMLIGVRACELHAIAIQEKVREVARKLSVSEADLYRKQRVAGE